MALSFDYQEETYRVGDSIRVHLKISEDDKTRIQVFEGLVIGIKGRQENKSFTVRKIGAKSVGVERIFPLMTPVIDKIELKARGKVRRAKLYYLRDRVGRKALRVKEDKTAQYASKKTNGKAPASGSKSRGTGKKSS